MSIRHSLLVLLEEQPMYGAQLRAEFERRTGGTWPLNIGQVYTTLARLERDGLVEGAGQPDADGKIPYRLTAAGHTEAQSWWDTPVERADAVRDELVIKLAMAVTLPGVDVAHIVQRQRTSTLRYQQELNRRLRGHPRDTPADVAAVLVLERLLYGADADIRWLEHLEAVLAGTAKPRPPAPIITPTFTSPGETT